MEECVCTVADGFITVYTSRTKHADRRLCSLHNTALHAGCVCAKNDAVRYVFCIIFDEECILHVACRMVFGKIHGGEYVPVVFHFRSVGDVESHTGKYIDDFVSHDGKRMAGS